MTGASNGMVRAWLLLPLLLGPDSCQPSCYGSLRSIATPANQVAAPWLTGRWVEHKSGERPTPGAWDVEVWAFRDTDDLILWTNPDNDDDHDAERSQPGGPMVGLKARLVQLKTMQLLEVVADPDLLPDDPLGDMPGYFVPLHSWVRITGGRDSVVLEWLEHDYVTDRLAHRRNRLPFTKLDGELVVLTGDASQLRTFVETAFEEASAAADSSGGPIEAGMYVRAIPAPTGGDGLGVLR